MRCAQSCSIAAALRACDFFNTLGMFGRFSSGMRVISKDMSAVEMEKAQGVVRLRRPERRQMAMVVECPDDLVSSTHPVRMVMAVVEKLDLESFPEPIKARAGQVGWDATDPQLLVALWLYACIRGIGFPLRGSRGVFFA